jgi:hypothetical protein
MQLESHIGDVICDWSHRYVTGDAICDCSSRNFTREHAHQNSIYSRPFGSGFSFPSHVLLYFYASNIDSSSQQDKISTSVTVLTGSPRESTTDARARSTDISIHLSPARRGESDSLGADLVAPTIRLHHSPKQQYLPDTYHKQVQGPRGTRQPYPGPR